MSGGKVVGRFIEKERERGREDSKTKLDKVEGH